MLSQSVDLVRGGIMAGLTKLALTTAVGFAVGRKWSAIRKVARETLTSVLQRGHLGFMLLPVTPSR